MNPGAAVCLLLVIILAAGWLASVLVRRIT